MARTGDQVLCLPTLPGTPVIVLSASEPIKETSELARIANEKGADIARLYPEARQVWVESGHAIGLEKPEAVVAALRAAPAANLAKRTFGDTGSRRCARWVQRLPTDADVPRDAERDITHIAWQ